MVLSVPSFPFFPSVLSLAKQTKDRWDAIGLVEVKHKVHPSDIEKLVSGKLPNFRKLFPQYADFDFYLGMAGMSFPKEAVEMAEKAGLAVLRQKGEVLLMNTNLRAY